MSLPKLAAFLVGALFVAWLSLPSLRAGWKHALPRSLAFLAIFGVILLNSDAWVAEPISALQLLSWALLLSSIVLAFLGFSALRKLGRPQGSVDRTTTLVTASIYRWIRHPLYASLLCLAWGALLKRVAPLPVALTAAATLLLIATAKLEEAFNASKFGPAYDEYRSRTKMFLPFLF